jgi:hypothetical protein
MSSFPEWHWVKVRQTRAIEAVSEAIEAGSRHAGPTRGYELEQNPAPKEGANAAVSTELNY